MSPTRGYYSLIQYCPDLSRLESANIGVVLFRPEPHFIRARTTDSVQRIRRFFGSEDRDWEQIRLLTAAIEERLEIEGEHFRTLEDLERFIATRGNEIQLTAPRPVKVFNPEQDLELLFERLVGGRPQRNAVQPVARRLEETFSQNELKPFIRRDVTVTVPAFHRLLTVPFGYQNGHFNLIRPAAFSQSPLSGAINRACRYAIEGRSLHDHPDETLGLLKLIVVGDFAPGQREAREVVSGILRENAVDLFTLADLPRLVEEIRTTGKAQTA